MVALLVQTYQTQKQEKKRTEAPEGEPMSKGTVVLIPTGNKLERKVRRPLGQRGKIERRDGGQSARKGILEEKNWKTLRGLGGGGRSNNL